MIEHPEAMTPNTPTPELERWNVHGYNPERSLDGEWCDYFEAAAAIAKLTAERDAALASRDRWKSVCVPQRVRELEAAEASNKLPSERVAVLETALEPFADLADLIGDAPPDVTMFYIMTKVDGEIIQMSLEYLRRALAAREAK